jgi:hypothetical protein
MYNLSLELIDTKNIEKEILKEMHKHVTKYFKNNAEYLEMSVANTLMTAILASPTMQELKSGRLKEELGVESVNEYGITMAIVNAAKLTVGVPKMAGGKIVGSIRLEAAPLDLGTLTSGYEDGIQKTAKGQTLPWLKWLTTLGDAVIVRDYTVKSGFPDKSRTGDKIMVKGSGWRVPPGHSGTQENNFLTRAIDEALPELEKDIMYYFNGALGVR